VIAAVSESGYLAVTVADIVRRARVSRVAFYAHFADKEDCFLTATAEGRELFRGVPRPRRGNGRTRGIPWSSWSASTPYPSWKKRWYHCI
jgi:hypothetical protein